MIPGSPSDKEIEESEGYLPDYEEIVVRLRVLEKELDDKRGGGISAEVMELSDNLIKLETEVENFQYNLKKNLEDILYALRFSIELREIPTMRWNRRVRI